MAIRAARGKYDFILEKSLQHKTLLLSVTKKVIVKIKLGCEICDNHEQMTSHGGFFIIIALLFTECKC